MQINATGANLASSNTNVRQNFKGKRDNVSAFIRLDDNTIQQMAYLKTINDVDDKKHNKLNKRLMNLVPVAAGLAAAVAMPKLGRLEKLMQFGKTTAKWFAAFGIIDLVFAAKNKIDKNVKPAGEFAQNHPFLSFLGTAALSFLALGGAYKGFGKLADKVMGPIINKYDAKITAGLLKAGNKLDKNKALNWLSKNFTKVAEKTPSAIKAFGKSVLNWSPVLLAVGSIAHSADHNSVKNKEFAKNYNTLKEKQQTLAKKRIAELEVQRERLLSNPESKENEDLIDLPLKELPDEIIDKVVQLRINRSKNK